MSVLFTRMELRYHQTSRAFFMSHLTLLEHGGSSSLKN